MSAPASRGIAKQSNRSAASGALLSAAASNGSVVPSSGILYNAVMVDRIPPTYQIKLSSTSSNGRSTDRAPLRNDERRLSKAWA